MQVLIDANSGFRSVAFAKGCTRFLFGRTNVVFRFAKSFKAAYNFARTTWAGKIEWR